MHDLVYESDINSVSKSVTLKEDMCHTLQTTGCWCEFQGCGIWTKTMWHITRSARVSSYSKILK